MAPQYDAVAELYQRTKRAPLRTYVEAFTFTQLLGELRGASVLDLACGEGFYSRRMKAAGAARVVGVDISAQMIRLAEEQELSSPLGIDYVCADVAMLADLGRFDIVAAAYLLHYAHDGKELRAMAQRIAAHLSPGGRFVALNENPVQPPERYAGYDQYGFNKTTTVPRSDGTDIVYWFLSGRDQFQITARHFSVETYEKALHDAGLVDIRWHALQLDPAGIESCGEDYWREYLDNPPIVALECRRLP